MNQFLIDASALGKHYVPERGTILMHHLFARVARDRLACLMLGAAEVVAALVRKRNGGLITPAAFAVAMAQLRVEVLNAPDFTKLPADNATINASLPLLQTYPVNANDGIVLQSALDFGSQAQATGHTLVLATSDQRLLRAAHAEGLVTFDPESQSQADLDALIGP
jgi:predicted nucleic acid-binding protein